MERDRGYSDADLAEVSDSPEWTEDEFARSKNFVEAFPDLAASLKDGVAVEVVGMTQVSIRLADEVLAHYRDGGGDWEERINADLRKAAGIKDRLAQ